MWYKFSQVIRTDLIVNADGSYTIRPGSKFFNAIKQELKQNPGLSNYPSRPINQVYPRQTSTPKAPTQNLNKPNQPGVIQATNTYKLKNGYLVKITQGRAFIVDNTGNELAKGEISWGATTSPTQILADIEKPGNFEKYFPTYIPKFPQQNAEQTTAQFTPLVNKNFGGFGGQSGQGSFSGLHPN